MGWVTWFSVLFLYGNKLEIEMSQTNCNMKRLSFTAVAVDLSFKNWSMAEELIGRNKISFSKQIVCRYDEIKF